MKKKKNYFKGFLIILVAVSVLILAFVIGKYLQLKNLSKREQAAIANEKRLEGALLDIKTEMSDVYGISFNMVLSGNEKGNVLPGWLVDLIGSRLNDDPVDNDSDLYINGYIYNGGADIQVSLINTRLSEDVEFTDNNNFIFITINSEGTYLINPLDMKYSILNISEDKYGVYDSSIKNNKILIGSGLAGRDIMDQLLRSVEALGFEDSLKMGVTEDGYKAFSFEDKVKLELGLATDFMFDFPASFSAYVIPSVSNVKGYTLEGYANGLKVSLTVVEKNIYSKRTIPNDTITLEEYKNIINGFSAVEGGE